MKPEMVFSTALSATSSATTLTASISRNAHQHDLMVVTVATTAAIEVTGITYQGGTFYRLGRAVGALHGIEIWIGHSFAGGLATGNPTVTYSAATTMRYARFHVFRNGEQQDAAPTTVTAASTASGNDSSIEVPALATGQADDLWLAASVHNNTTVPNATTGYAPTPSDTQGIGKVAGALSPLSHVSYQRASPAAETVGMVATITAAEWVAVAAVIRLQAPDIDDTAHAYLGRDDKADDLVAGAA